MKYVGLASFVVSLVIFVLTAFTACGGNPKVACTAEQVAIYAPRIEAAVASKDYIALATLAEELGHDVYVCILKSKGSASAAGSGSSTGKPPADGGI